jgi:hypothetical protein
MSHRGYPGGHHSEVALFTGVAPEGVRDMNAIRNTISLDQEAAERLGSETRFSYLSLGGGGTGALSWNRKGVKVPAEGRATQVFKQLFIDGTPADVSRELQRLQAGRSILDGVREQARTLSQSLGPTDRDRLENLLDSIREAERRLQQDEAWAKKPKPKVTVTPLADDYLVGHELRAVGATRRRAWVELNGGGGIVADNRLARRALRSRIAGRACDGNCQAMSTVKGWKSLRHVQDGRVRGILKVLS